MNKRFTIRFTALLVVIVCTVLMMSIPTMAVNNGNATLVKSYNKDGKFHMVIDLTYPDDGYVCTTFEIFLTDQGGDVITRWDTITSNYAYGTKQYTFSRSYADTPDGQYTMNVVITDVYDRSKNFSWVINHKKVVSLTFIDTYKVKNTDGTYSQMFRFSALNGKNKTYHMELYTADGKFVRAFSTKDQYDKSTFRVKWNYFPQKGVKMKSGSYILKYWPDGGNPKQMTIDISI